MEKPQRDTKLVRVKIETLDGIGEYLAKSGSSIMHVTTEALEYWKKTKMPKLLKLLDK
jgi:hypothetical protein